MSSVTYMHGPTVTEGVQYGPSKSAQLIDDVIDLWIKGKGPAPEMVSDPDYVYISPSLPEHTRADYDAYVSRVKVSRTGVVTAVKARKTTARKTVAKCCPHCGGAL